MFELYSNFLKKSRKERGILMKPFHLITARQGADIPLEFASEKSSEPETLLLPLAVDVPSWQKELFCCNEDIAADILEAYGFGYDTTEDEAVSFIEALVIEDIRMKVGPYGCYLVISLCAKDSGKQKLTYPLCLTDSEISSLCAFLTALTPEQLGISRFCYYHTMKFLE